MTAATHPPRRSWHRNPALLALACAVLALCLYCLPVSSSPAMENCSTIVASLRNSQNWGRQALVGSLEYGPLQTLFLLACQSLGGAIGLSAGKLYSVICQSIIMVTLLLWQKNHGRAGRGLAGAALLLAGALFFPPLRELLSYAAVSPAWLNAALLCTLFYQFSQWHREQELRWLVLCAASLSLLMLCGSCGIMLALGCIPVLLREISCTLDDHEKFSGLPTLLLLPAGYALLLYFVWNWLVLDDALFFLRDYWSRASSLPLAALLHFPPASRRLGLLFLLLAALTTLLCFDRTCKAPARLLLPLALLLPLHFHFTQIMQVYSGGLPAYLLAVLLALLLVLNSSDYRRRQRTTQFLLSLALLYCALPIGVSACFQPAGGAPPRTELTAYIDQFWPDSRIMLYGLPLALAYPDLQEHRFQARLDYQEGDFLTQARDEQLHLLVPPPDGKYYPARKSVLAEIHAQGRPWLFLEKQWPGGWQLWRCVIPPEGESKLDALR
ncbi:MAG: hypothetical protein GX564_02640 [Oligosphaeraceae bacterium]|nr:hypothetical protein [Oligosphaeraceae bacterium]